MTKHVTGAYCTSRGFKGPALKALQSPGGSVPTARVHKALMGTSPSWHRECKLEDASKTPETHAAIAQSDCLMLVVAETTGRPATQEAADHYKHRHSSHGPHRTKPSTWTC